MYDVYISTQSHDHKDLYFEQEVYYYQWILINLLQTLLDSLLVAELQVGVDPSIWSELEYEFNY